MLFFNWPTSNESTPRNLQLCPQTSKRGPYYIRIHFITFVRTLPIVSKCEISYYVCTFIVRKFQNFTIIVDQIENTAKMDNYFIHQASISNCNTAEPSLESSFEVCGQSCAFQSVNSFDDW